MKPVFCVLIGVLLLPLLTAAQPEELTEAEAIERALVHPEWQTLMASQLEIAQGQAEQTGR